MSKQVKPSKSAKIIKTAKSTKPLKTVKDTSDSEVEEKKYKISPNGDIDSDSDESEFSEAELSEKEEELSEEESYDSDNDDKKNKKNKKSVDDEDEDIEDIEEDEIIIQNDDEENVSTSIVYNKIVPNHLRKTSDYLQIFECGRIIGDFARALANGAKPYIDITNMPNEYVIAYNSLLQRKIPFCLLRRHGKNSYEKWNVSEMQIPKLPPVSVFMKHY